MPDDRVAQRIVEFDFGCKSLVWPEGIFWFLAALMLAFGLSGRFSMTQDPSWPRSLLFLALMALVYGLMLQNEAFRSQSFRSLTSNALAVALVLLFLFYSFCLSLPASGLKPLLIVGERSIDVYLTHLLFIRGCASSCTRYWAWTARS